MPDSRKQQISDLPSGKFSDFINSNQISDHPHHDGRELEPPVPGEGAIHGEYRKARNDVVNLYRLVDGYADMGCLTPYEIRTMVIELHMLMQRHLCRLNRMERKVGRVCNG